MNWISLTAESPGVIRDENGVPVEWTLLHVGSNPICQEGKDGALVLSADAMQQIMEYHEKKGELIPVDSEHYLFELANQKKLDEAETLKLFPGGVAALGFGSLALAGEELRIKVKWNPAAYEMLKEKIYKYFSPVIRGLENGPLRVTSVAMTKPGRARRAIRNHQARNGRKGNDHESGTEGRLAEGAGRNGAGAGQQPADAYLNPRTSCMSYMPGFAFIR